MLAAVAGPRMILYTGKGGVGTTSLAAATARRLAASGRRTLVLSTDPAHGLGDVLELPLGPDVRPAGPLLDAQQVSAQDALDRRWRAVREWLGELLARSGAGHLSAEEPTVPPGLDELFGLLELHRHHERDAYDAIVVDCAATGATLRLLGLPDLARRWLGQAVPRRPGILATARSAARARPGEAVLGDVHEAVRGIVAMNELLRDSERVSVRLVTTPERIVLDETRRVFTYLALYGFPTDAIIVNRVLPPESGEWLAPVRERQRERMAQIETSFAPLPVLRAPHLPDEVVGEEMLDRLGAELFAGRDAAAVLHERATQDLVVGAREAILRLTLPFADKDEIAVRMVGSDLVVRAGGHRRALALPPALADYRPAGARFESGTLLVRFDREAVVADA